MLAIRSALMVTCALLACSFASSAHGQGIVEYAIPAGDEALYDCYFGPPIANATVTIENEGNWGVSVIITSVTATAIWQFWVFVQGEDTEQIQVPGAVVDVTASSGGPRAYGSVTVQ